MLKLARLIFAGAFVVFFAAGARAEEPAVDQVAAGHALALKVCAFCHVVAKDQPNPPLLRNPAPPFLKLARRKTLSESSLRALLSTPHGNLGKNAQMPNPQLVDYQIDEIIAYFMSLKGGR